MSEARLASGQGNHRLQEGRPGMLWKGLAAVQGRWWLCGWQAPQGSEITALTHRGTGRLPRPPGAD